MATNINLTFKVLIPLFVVAAVGEDIFDSWEAALQAVLLPHVPQTPAEECSYAQLQLAMLVCLRNPKVSLL